MKAPTRITIFIALAAVLASIGGCDADSPTSPGGKGSAAEIAPDVFVVDVKAGLSFVEASDSTLVFDLLGPGAPPIPTGGVIVGSDGGGYIRRVHSMSVSGGRLYIGARPAVLTDAVVSGILDATTSIGFSSGLDLSNVILYSGDAGGAPLSVAIASGRIDFKPAIDLSMRIVPYKLHRFAASAAGELRLACEIGVEALGPVAGVRSMPIASIRKPFVSYLGPVPVAAAVTMTLMARLEVSSDTAFACSLGIDISGPMRCGIRLDRGAWSISSDASPAYAARPFQYESEGGARVSISIEPKIEIEFYGAPCVDLVFGPSFGLEERDEGFSVLAWELFASYRSAAAFDRGALDRYTPPFESERVRCCATTLASGPFHTDDYALAGQWGIEGPPGSAFSYPKGIAVDAAGDVYVVESWNGEVQKFTAEGALLRRWGEPGAGDGQFEAPEKVAVDEDGFVYVVDGGSNRIQKFSSAGAFVLKWGSEGGGDGQFRSPVGVAAAGGVVYVTDGRNNRVQKFSTSGDFLGAWGEYGAAPGRFNGPMGVAIDPADETVLVADCQNHRIQRFSPDGALLAAWGSYGAGDGQFNCAVDVTVAAGGAVFVADIGNDRFARFTADGTFETKLGTTGTAEGQFDHPEGVVVDGRGFVYVLDARNSRIQRFEPRIR